MLAGFDLIHLNTELLPPRPSNDRAVNKYSRVLVGEKNTERDDHARLNRMSPIDTPSIEGEVPGYAGSLEGIAGIVHRTRDGKATKGSHLKSGADGWGRTKREPWSDLLIATSHCVPQRSIPASLGVSDGFRITPSTQPNQSNQPLTSANCSKTEQIVRKSATNRNQDAGPQDDSADDAVFEEERGL